MLRRFLHISLIGTGVLVGTVCLVTAEVGAQSSFYDSGNSGVTVDLSVLGGGGSPPRTSMPTTSPVMPGASGSVLSRFDVVPQALGSGNLLVPGSRPPSSRLHVTPAPSKATKRKAKRKTVKKPRQRVAKRAPRSTPAKVTKKAPPLPPTKKKAPKVAAATSPPPPPPALKVKKPAPAKVAKAKPVEKAMPRTVKKAPPVAPKVAASTSTKAEPPPPLPKTRPTPLKKPEPAPKPKPAPAAKAEKPAKKITTPVPAMTPPPPPPPATVAKKKVTPPPAPKAVAAIPKKTPATPKSAAAPTTAPLVPGHQALRVVFAQSASKLPNGAKPNLKTLADRLNQQPKLRLQLLAYAGGSSLASSKARRLSLSRALAVRSFLIENGVRSTRIDVRALGNKTTEEPLHRVDMNVAER